MWFTTGLMVQIELPSSTSPSHAVDPPILRGVGIGLGLGGVALLLTLVVMPSLTLVVNSLQVDQQLSLANYTTVLGRIQTYRVLGNSFLVALCGTLGATVLGTGLAWVIARTDVPWRGFWRGALLLPYMIPPFIGAIAWIYLLGRAGYLNKLWMALTGSTDPLLVVAGPVGIVFVMILFGFPIAYLVTLGPLEQMDAALEEAARVSGAGTLQTLRDVVVPLMMPSIGSAALLVFTTLMANFGIPSIIGLPDRYYVMTTQIYATILNTFQDNNLQQAAALSMVLVVISLVGLQLQRWLIRSGNYRVVTGRGGQPQRLSLGRWRGWVVAGLAGIFLMTVVAPLIAISLNALLRAIGLPITWENLSLRHFQAVLFEFPKARRAAVNSLLLATGSTTAIAGLAVIISYLVVRVRIRGGRWLENLTTLPFAVPGTIVALALILTFLRPIPILGWELYNTLWILYIAYIARFLTLGVRSVSAGLEQIDPSLEDAARMCGARPEQGIWDVTLPLIRNSIFAGWFLAFVPCLAELTVSILLASVNNETLGITVFGLYQEGKVGMTAAMALVLTVLVLGIYGVIRLLTRGRFEMLN